MDLDLLLVDYFQNTSVIWKLRWQRGMVVRARGELSGWDGVDFLRSVQRGWDGVDFLRAVQRSWDEVDFLRSVQRIWDGVDFLRAV